MSTPEMVAVLEQFAEVLERLGVPYQIGGSVASSTQGVVRATLDVDLVADLRPEQVPALAAALRPDFYVDEELVLEALARGGSWNVVHIETIVKVDVFGLKPRAYDPVAFSRTREDTLGSGPAARRFPFFTPEDVILNKLEWFERGGGVSDRQWGDVLGLLRAQGGRLDRAYLERWAAELGLGDLLERALKASSQAP